MSAVTTRKSFAGQLGAIGLPQVLSKLQAEGLTGVVVVSAGLGRGRIWLTAGTLLDAELGGTRGLKALDILLASKKGSFQVELGEHERTRAIRASLAELLARRPKSRDDFDSVVEVLPSLSARLRVDDGLLAGERLELDAQQGRLIQLLDGKRSLAGVVQECTQFASETLVQVADWVRRGLVHTAGTLSTVPTTQRVSARPGESLPTPTLRRGSPVPGRGEVLVEQDAADLGRSHEGFAATRVASPAPAAYPSQEVGAPTRLGVPSVSTNPPPRQSNAPPRDFRTTRLGVPGISSNPPPRHSKPPLGPQATQPGFALDQREARVSVAASTASPETPKMGRSGGAPPRFASTVVVGSPEERPGRNGVELTPSIASVEISPTRSSLPQTTALSPLSSRLTLGGYHLAGKVRACSTGDVFRARVDRAGPSQEVHLLAVPVSKGGAALVNVESRVSARLQHRNALTAVDQGVEGERAYVAMEAVDGVTLAALLEAQPNAARVGVLVRVLVDCLAALGALHDYTEVDGRHVGASHNAVLPANIVVGTDGRGRIAMFGRVTFGEEASPKADIQAVARILWEGLTGRTLSTSGKLPKVSELMGYVSPELDEFCERALSPSHPDRFTTARSAEAALAELAQTTRIWPARKDIAIWARNRKRGGLEAAPAKAAPEPIGSAMGIATKPPGVHAAGPVGVSGARVAPRQVAAPALPTTHPERSAEQSGLRRAGAVVLAVGCAAAVMGGTLALTGSASPAAGGGLAGVGGIALVAGGVLVSRTRRRSGGGQQVPPIELDAPPASEAYPDEEVQPISTSQVVIYEPSPPWSKETLSLRDNAAELSAKILSYPVDRCLVVGVTGAARTPMTRATTAANLAYKLCRMRGQRVLLLECDFVHPGVCRVMDVVMPMGASASRQMDGGDVHDDPRVHVLGCLPNLHVLGEGVIRSPGALFSPRASAFMDNLRSTYDIVVVSGPGIEQEPDYSAFVPLVDGLVRVACEASVEPVGLPPGAAKLFSLAHVAPRLDS